ncbi:MAG: M23 family metallopeptidase [Bacteroidota bacterium]
MKFCAYCVGLTGLGVVLLGLAVYQKIVRPKFALSRTIICVEPAQTEPNPIPESRVPSLRPVADRYKISSPFGVRLHPVVKRYRMHRGVDFPSPTGTPVRAAASGTVQDMVVKKGQSTYGKYVMLCHDDAYSSLYAHLSKVLVKAGQEVVRGDTIGLSGNTGLSKGPHLHFEVFHYDKRIDPMRIWEQNLTPVPSAFSSNTYASNP